MKNLIKVVGLMTLIGFSFFYTDKVIEVIREEDRVMVELSSVQDIYRVDPVDASIVSNTIIPGLNGRKINLEQSYKNMKGNGVFNQSLIFYDTILPDISVQNHKDKFIILGNHYKQMVSIVFILNQDKYLDKIEEILQSKGVVANYFVDYSYLMEHSTKIKKMENREFYSYGDNGRYTPDNLLFSNNLISRIRDNRAIYCLSGSMDENVLELCSKNDLYTIVPNIICDKQPYSAVSANLSSGSIILLSMNQETVNELATVIEYIKGKGLKIGGLSELLSENLSGT